MRIEQRSRLDSSAMQRGCLRLVVCGLSLLTACVSQSRGWTTKWPPKDFYLAVSYRAHVDGELRETRRFEVWQDGLCALREADRGIGGKAVSTRWFPVFDRAAAWRMHDDSIRQLSRLIDQAYFFSLPSVKTDGQTGLGDQVSIRCRSRGEYRTVWLHKEAYSSIARVVHIVNAFLPDGHQFRLPAMVGEREDPHLSRIPQPFLSSEGAIVFHEDQIDRLPDEHKLELLVDLFSLLVDTGKKKRAKRVLAKIEAEAKEREPAFLPFPEGSQTDRVDQLRRLL